MGVYEVMGTEFMNRNVVEILRGKQNVKECHGTVKFRHWTIPITGQGSYRRQDGQMNALDLDMWSKERI